MEVTAPETGPDVGAAEHDPSRRRRRRLTGRLVMGHPEGIVSGLSAHIAERVAVDPLWIRLAFVAGALAGGVGLLIYAGLWLALLAARSTAARVAGWTLVVGAAVLLAVNDVGFVTGPIAVVGLLAGLALALWRPVPSWAEPGASTSSDPTQPPSTARQAHRGRDRSADSATSSPGSQPRVSDQRAGPVNRPVRPVSMLGRVTLAAALIVAAVGALVDETNGGRLHPEQWLGAAAIVCGVGLLVGTVRGHARWLVVPAALFAAGGYVTGQAARLDVSPVDAFSDDSALVFADSVGPYRVHTVFGTARVDIQQAPAVPATIDVRTASGMELWLHDDVAVEIVSPSGPVTMRHDGTERVASTFTLGPDRDADVVIDLHMTRGEIRVFDSGSDPVDVIPPDPAVPPIVAPPASQPTGRDGYRPADATVRSALDAGDGIVVTGDGDVIIAGSTTIDPNDNVIPTGDVGPIWIDETTMLLPTRLGDYRYMTPILFTPNGTWHDLDALRARATEMSEQSPPDTASSIPPSTEETSLPVPTQTDPDADPEDS